MCVLPFATCTLLVNNTLAKLVVFVNLWVNLNIMKQFTKKLFIEKRGAGQQENAGVLIILIIGV